jgi:hypothetical protein
MISTPSLFDGDTTFPVSCRRKTPAGFLSSRPCRKRIQG